MKILRTVPFLFVLFASLLVVQLPTHANSLPLTVSVGYADNTHCSTYNSPLPGFPPGSTCVSPLPALFPSPWKGSPNTSFIGKGVQDVGFDAGALLLTNNSGADVNVADVNVNIGGTPFDLWGSFTVPNDQSVILTQTNFDPLTLMPNFDTSDLTTCCSNNGVIPSIAITIGSTTTTLLDTNQILNTGGFDLGCLDQGCVLTNESHDWSLIPGQVAAAPEPSSMLLLGSGLLCLGVGFRRKFHR
jgi:PEP-CTERM motif